MKHTLSPSLPSGQTQLTATKRMKITAEALGAIARARRFNLTATTFNELWSEISSFDTYGGKGLVFVDFIRHHNDNQYWFERTKKLFVVEGH